MGKSKGGGGGSTPGIQGIQQGLQGQSYIFQGLGDWERQFLSQPYNIGNYYMDLATGGGGPQASGSAMGFGTQGVTPYGSGGPGSNAGAGSGLFGSNNPWVSGLEQSLQAQGNAIPGMQTEVSTLQGEAASQYGYANTMRNQLQHGGGLFPDQQALIQAQVQSGQNQVSQQLASEGLGSSTMGASLNSEIGLQGAATGGQLIQGNISAVNQADQIANLANGTALAGQSQFFQELTSIGQQNLTAQSTFFQQAMSGYGAAGAALQNVLAPYGYQLQDYSTMGNLAIGQANIQAQQANAATAAQGQGLSGLFSGLGSLLGGSGGGLSALGGAAGSAVSGIGGALGAAGGAIGGAASGAVSGIGAALSALFCEVARTVYGLDSPDWLFFRDWILFRAPKSVRFLYIRNADQVSRFIKGRKLLCTLIRWIFNLVLYVDKIAAKTEKRRSAQQVIA